MYRPSGKQCPRIIINEHATPSDPSFTPRTANRPYSCCALHSLPEVPSSHFLREEIGTQRYIVFYELCMAYVCITSLKMAHMGVLTVPCSKAASCFCCFLFLYKFTDHCHQVETQLPFINIKYEISWIMWDQEGKGNWHIPNSLPRYFCTPRNRTTEKLKLLFM